MSRSWKALLLVGVLVTAAAGSANAAPPFDLTLSGPTGFVPGQALSAPFTGALTASGLGVPNQTIELFVDNQITASAATTLQGTYAISLPPFTGTADKTIKAVAFRGTPLETSTTMIVEVVRYALTVNTAGSGAGTVTSSPGGISCPGTCSGVFVATSAVTLTAVPRPGSIFAGWSGGGCTGTGSCTITMNAPTSVTATFVMQTFSLTVSRAGAGSGTVSSAPAGISCGTDCSENYPFGTMVSLNAAPSVGSTFAGWSGGCTGTGICTVTMNASTTVTANFILQTFPLTVTKAGSGSGTVTSSPAGINCGTDCTQTYNHGTVVTLTASASFFSFFTGWSGGGCTGTGACVVSMTTARTVTATFS